jgi:ribosomal protein S3AE
MAKVKRKVSKIKIKKKLWFKIVAPKLFGSKEIGESYLPSADAAVGRIMGVNLRNLSGSIRDQNVYITFKISGVQGTTLQTSTLGYKLLPTYIKRMVRKNTNRLDDYFELPLQNGNKVVLKTIMVTLGKTQRSTRSALRVALESFLEEEISKTDFSTFVSTLVNKKIQSAAKKKLQKIHPVKEVAVRFLQIQSDEKVEKLEVAPEAPAEKVKEEPVAEEPVEKSTEEPAKESKEESAEE